MNSIKPIIVWFRQDLRTTDNPALIAAQDAERPVIPIFVLDDHSAEEWRAGSASRWWLHRSLTVLDESLGGNMRFFVGNAADVVPQVATDVGADKVFWNRCYEPWRIKRDTRIKTNLRKAGVAAESFAGALLFEPHSVLKPDGTPYKVFTPYYRKGCLQNSPAPAEPAGAADGVSYLATNIGGNLADLKLLPDKLWYSEMEVSWQPGESGAHQRLDTFLESGISGYKEGRNRPDQAFVSRLSPHLHFGELSPRQAWHAVLRHQAMRGSEDDADHFLSELGWREFSHYLLFHWPELPRHNLQPKFDRFPWRDDADALAAWQRGRTGYPIVDAGMRELWRTGYMHNRVRMIVGSFLVKNLLLHWHHGEEWFWDTLVDADLANNSASWQWIAGCGADAAPYFRIFNPVTQGNKFDPNGDYVRHYVPEIAALPTKHLHAPWEASETVLEAANIRLGVHYPLPIVDLKESRERALAAFGSLKA